MGVKQLQINDALVAIDDSYVHRWYGLIGNGQGYDLEQGFPVDDTTGDPTQFIYTPTEGGTGSTLFTHAATGLGDRALLTNAAAEYDGANIQLKGEAITVTAGKPFYCGAKIKISDATQSDFLFGLAAADTTLLNVSGSHAIAVADGGLFFAKLDAVTTISAKAYVGGSQTATANSATVMTTGYHTYEIYYDGSSVNFYVDAALVTCINADLPDSEMTLSFNFRNGAAAVKTATIQWMRAFQVN